MIEAWPSTNGRVGLQCAAHSAQGNVLIAEIHPNTDWHLSERLDAVAHLLATRKRIKQQIALMAGPAGGHAATTATAAPLCLVKQAEIDPVFDQ
jgi:hypothetical protein